MRMFIAISLPGETKERLHRLMKPLDGVRWQNPEQLHITLKFLGDTASGQVKELVKNLNMVEQAPFPFAIKGLGYFPEGEQPRVIWTGIEDDSAFVKLHRSVENACKKTGFSREKRPYRPHITLGKVKGASKDEITSFITRNKDVYIGDIPAEEFILYESRLQSDGAVHEPSARFPLEGITEAKQKGDET